MAICANEKRFWGASDAETIQNAIDYAAANDLGEVVIPRLCERTGRTVWSIDRSILLPNDITVTLESAHLRLADGVFENIFRNKNCRTSEGNTLDGEQHGIRIIGTGNALLDGGTHNGLVEQMHRDDPEKYPCLSINLLVFLHNVRDFEIRGLHVVNSRWWAVCCIYCRWGRIADLDFRMYGTCENQDGVDLRVGCEFITIENITGCTGDDTIALTALPLDDLVPETALKVEGKAPDIHDVTIRNVISSSHGCNLIRLLCEDGAKEYNITIEDVKDSGFSISGGAILVGIANTLFAKDHPRKMGDLRNVVIRNVCTSSQKAIVLCEPTQDLLIENVATYGRNNLGIRFTGNFVADNVVIRNCTFRGDTDEANCLFDGSEELTEDALKGLTIEHVRATPYAYVFRRCRLPVSDLVCTPKEGEFHPEKPKLPSAYGRYHRCAFGKEIKNRPEDNRFTGK